MLEHTGQFDSDAPPKAFILFSLVAGLRYLKTNFGSPGWMGNEASSVRIHAALTAEDIKVNRGTTHHMRSYTYETMLP